MQAGRESQTRDATAQADDDPPAAAAATSGVRLLKGFLRKPCFRGSPEAYAVHDPRTVVIHLPGLKGGHLGEQSGTTRKGGGVVKVRTARQDSGPSKHHLRLSIKMQHRHIRQW